jgi:hypothetical protein
MELLKREECNRNEAIKEPHLESNILIRLIAQLN